MSFSRFVGSGRNSQGSVRFSPHGSRQGIKNAMTKEEIVELYKWFSDNADTGSEDADIGLVIAYVISHT